MCHRTVPRYFQMLCEIFRNEIFRKVPRYDSQVPSYDSKVPRYEFLEDICKWKFLCIIT